MDLAGRRIAIVEDDPEFGDLLVELLKRQEYEVALYPTAGRLFDSLARGLPHLILLDMQLPGMDGAEILRVLRGGEQTRDLWIVAMSGRRASTRDVICGLRLGADEYLVKPVDTELLLARVEGFLRRSRGNGNGERPEEVVRVRGLSLYPERRAAELGGKAVVLTHLEFDLLLHLARNPNRVMTRGLLLEMVWKGDPSMQTRTVDKHVENLRSKLGSLGELLETVVRVGYVLRA